MCAGAVNEIKQSNAFSEWKTCNVCRVYTQQVLGANQFNAIKDNEDYPGLYDYRKSLNGGEKAPKY